MLYSSSSHPVAHVWSTSLLPAASAHLADGDGQQLALRPQHSVGLCERCSDPLHHGRGGRPGGHTVREQHILRGARGRGRQATDTCTHTHARTQKHTHFVGMRRTTSWRTAQRDATMHGATAWCVACHSAPQYRVYECSD